jgi:purine-cytosine permease-like protein
VPPTDAESGSATTPVARAATGAVRALWTDSGLRTLWIVGLVVGAGFAFTPMPGPALGVVIAVLGVLVAWLQGFLTLLAFERRRERRRR